MYVTVTCPENETHEQKKKKKGYKKGIVRSDVGKRARLLCIERNKGFWKRK